MSSRYKTKKNSSCKQLLRSIDIYAKPVQLTYKGSEKFRSTFGGIISLAVVIFFFSVFVYKLNDMFNKSQTQIKKNTLVSISNEYTPPEVLSDKNITFAFMLSDFYGSGAFDNPYYGDLFLNQNIINIKVNETTGESYREFIDYSIPFSKCKIGKNFFYPDPEEIKNYQIESFYCPDWFNLTIQGNWYSPEYKLVTLGFRRCSGKNCATEEEFQSWVGKITMQEIIISSYFDVSDYENPVHYFLDDLYLPFQYNRSVVSNNYIRRNKLELHDNLFGIFNDQVDLTFYQKSERIYFTSDVNEGPGEGIMFFQNFYLDKNYDIYERRVYSFSGVLQDVGGIYNSLFFAGLFIYGRFQGSIYFSSIISKLYQVEEFKKGTKKQKKLKNGKLDQNSEHENEDDDDDDENLKKQLSRSSHLSFKTGVFSRRGSYLSGFSQLHEMSMGIKEVFLQSIQSRNFSKDAYENIKDYLKNRWRIKISFQDILVFSFWRLLGFFRCCRRNKQDSLNQRKIHLYKKGEEKIKRELDCVNLMTKLRQLDLLLSLQLDKNQKFLLNLQKKHLIQEVDTSTDEDKNNIVVVSKFDSNTQNDKTQSKFMKSLNLQLNSIQSKSELTEIDKKILIGLVTKNPHRYINNPAIKESLKLYDKKSTRKNINLSSSSSGNFFVPQKIIEAKTSPSRRYLLKNVQNLDTNIDDQFEKQQQKYAIENSQINQLKDVIQSIKSKQITQSPQSEQKKHVGARKKVYKQRIKTFNIAKLPFSGNRDLNLLQ
ncbi:UNKNOWN [Stylonychia lemnae]|uniref:Transmembrane protein n=1 Tax=Stylonychia lemnae TaxID=5949 RepID=A0A078AJB0_STYLE|nr:UNKNOWN [Stylonychia lemnae]|eukprot:CDW81986.1 UNKNOWN [Stylonychia lemnae]